MKRGKKTERQKLIKANDDLFRLIILKRDNSTCQRSNLKNNIQVAHFITRSNLRVRWDEDNACCLNKGVHYFWAHSKHEEFRDFWIERIGEQAFQALKLKARYCAPVRTEELKRINLYLRSIT